MTALIPEDCYAARKRFLFVQNVIEDHAPQRILDVGCGTGTALTRPIAVAFPAIEVVGVDTDTTSIAWAQGQSGLPNATFLAAAELEPETPFDLVCLHGPAIKRQLTRLRRSREAGDQTRSAKRTLAVSPHVNFFRMAPLRSLFAAAGFEIDRSQPTTLFSGPGVEPVLRAFNAIEWNARVCDRLPAWCASDWMFVLRPTEPVPAATWERGAFARFRRRLNLSRWGVGEPATAPQMACSSRAEATPLA